MMIETTQKHLPSTKIILLFPFCLPIGHYQKVWDEPLRKQHAILEDFAKQYHLQMINLHSRFQDAAKKIPMENLLPDGVHTGPEGNQLIADAVVKLIKQR